MAVTPDHGIHWQSCERQHTPAESDRSGSDEAASSIPYCAASTTAATERLWASASRQAAASNGPAPLPPGAVAAAETDTTAESMDAEPAVEAGSSC